MPRCPFAFIGESNTLISLRIQAYRPFSYIPVKYSRGYNSFIF